MMLSAYVDTEDSMVSVGRVDVSTLVAERQIARSPRRPLTQPGVL